MIFSSAINDAGNSFSKIKTELIIEDTALGGMSPRGFGGYKAWAYVKAAAVLERATRELLRVLLIELHRVAPPVLSVRASLLAIMGDPHLKSLSDLRAYEKIWKKRCELFQMSKSQQPAEFLLDALPLDGRTLRPQHFETIWAVFGFSEPVLPSPLHKLALTELADFRNKLAHGSVDPEEIQRTKTFREVTRMVEHAEDIVVHLATAEEEYLANSGYLSA